MKPSIQEYARTIGPFSAIMLIAGSMIGSGIFIVPAEMVRTGGTGAFLMLAWGLTALLTLMGAHSYGELAGMFPRAGGQYTYLREAYGPMPAFLYGWTVFSIIECGAIAAVAMAFAKFLGTLAPGVSETHFLVGPLHIPAIQVSAGVTVGPYHLGLTPARLCAIGVILSLSCLNAFGARLGVWVQNTFTVAKLGALAALILMGLLLAPSTPQGAGAWASPGMAAGALPFLAALLVVQSGSMFSSDSWNQITFIASEVKEPRRTIPLALLVGPLMVLGLYLLANLVYLRVLGPSAIATAPGDRVGSLALGTLVGGKGDRIMTLAILVSTFGCVNGLIMAGSRLYQAMAADGLFFRKAAQLNGRQVPAWSMAIQAFWASMLTLTGNYGQLLEFSIFASLLFYVLTVGGIFVLRRRRPELERPVKIFAYPVVPALYLLGLLAVMASLLVYRPSYTWPGLFLTATGIPVYFLIHRRSAGAKGSMRACSQADCPSPTD
jgi:APA family basic amino acid/polyamine antiporter